MSDPAVYTVEEAARLLRIGRSAAYDAARRGELPGVLRIGRTIRISRHRLEQALGIQNDNDPAGNRAEVETIAGSGGEDARAS